MNFLNSISNLGKSFYLRPKSWIQLGADIISEGSGDKNGYSVSINASGNRVAIGAPLNGGTDRGHVRIYSWNGTAWTQLGLDIDGEGSFDESGISVSMNAAGDRVAIGAHLNDGASGSSRGHVRIYSWDGAYWTQLGLDIDGEASLDQSGTSVSMNAAGDRVAIGAPLNNELNNENDSEPGHTRIYSWNGSAWTQLGTDINGAASSDSLGKSVSMNSIGDIIAIGVPGGDISEFDNRGIVRIYSWNGANWTQLGADIVGRYSSDDSGWSVSINAAGDTVVIGSPAYDGSVRIFQLI